MSVTTEMDRKIEKVREHLKDARTELHSALNEDIWGYSDYSSEYIQTLHEMLLKLHEIQNKI